MTTDEGERASQLEHLAEMDQLLRDIQVELMPGREPAPVLANDAPIDPPPPPDPPSVAPTATTAPDPALPTAPPTAPPQRPGPPLPPVTELATHLLASTRELLAGYERVLAPHAAPAPPPGGTPRRPVRRRPESPDVTLSAGPFARLESLRQFEQAVSSLPGVREVTVRGYEGTDRAIIEVRLDPPR